MYLITYSHWILELELDQTNGQKLNYMFNLLYFMNLNVGIIIFETERKTIEIRLFDFISIAIFDIFIRTSI